MGRPIRVASLLCFFLAAAAAAESLPLRFQTVSSDGTATTHEARIERGSIVELAAPRVAASGQRAARAAMLAQFRGDLARVTAVPASRIRHEYSAVFFGVAVDAPPEALANLRALGYVRAIHRDRTVRAYQADAPIDARPRVNAQSFAGGGSGIVVAILDTGIDYMHLALGGGYGPSFKVIGGHDFVNDDADGMDDHGHGTHVAGTVAANGAGLVGVAPEARLLAFKVLDQRGSGSTSDIIAGIERSLDPNGDGDRADAADVINLSLGGPGTAEDPVSRAIDSVVAQGVIAVVAAGNAGETATIGSPGTAASAITVGAVDGAGVIAPFSSRGPTSKLLTFKPEIMAPGVAILSARRGGGIASANGTSMATPHVAGVAALLVQLHPEWTPARVKSAIVAGAVSMPGSGFARGAGRIDAARAANASVVLSEAGVSFGLSHRATGTGEQTRSITVTNAGATSERFVLAPPVAPPPGLSMTGTPASIDLAPGASAVVTLQLSIDNAVQSFPEELVVSGDIRFNAISGARSFTIPWALLRAARATFTYDDLPVALIPLTERNSGKAVPYGTGEFEMFAKPGSTWDFILVGAGFDETNPGSGDVRELRFLIVEKALLDGDIAVPFTAAAASVRLTYAGRDADGRLFGELPVEEGLRRRFADVRVHLADGEWTFGLSIASWGLREVFITPASARYTVIPYEGYVDARAMRGYVVQHDAIAGPSTSATLETPPSSYLRATLRWERPALPPDPFLACIATAYMGGKGFIYGVNGCLGRDVEGPIAFEYYTTPRKRDDTFEGMAFQTGQLTTPSFRGLENTIVASADAAPARTAPQIAHGGEATLGCGLFHPFAYHGTTAGLFVFWPYANFFGPYGETLRSDTAPAHWETFDAAGNRTGRGVVQVQGGSLPLAAVNGSRLVVRREWRHQSGLTSGGTLDVAFATAGNDLTAPTITSMAVQNAAGLPRARLAVAAPATLLFSAADLDHGKRMEPQPMKTDGTRALWRRAGAPTWEPLALALVETESGNTNTLRHVPAGDIWRADLTAATAAPGLIDLRIELEDLAGNRMQWTQEGALFVGPEGSPPVRGRRVTRP